MSHKKLWAWKWSEAQVDWVVVHICNPSIWEAETGGSTRVYEASLDYIVCSNTIWVTQKDPASTIKWPQQKNKDTMSNYDPCG